MLDFIAGLAVGAVGGFMLCKALGPNISADGKTILHNGSVYLHTGVQATTAEFQKLAAEIRARFSTLTGKAGI